MKYKRPFKKCHLCAAHVTRLDQHLKKVHSVEQEESRKSKTKECLSSLYKKWLESPDSGGLTKVTIARNGQIFERVFKEKSIRSLKNLLDENLIRDIC